MNNHREIPVHDLETREALPFVISTFGRLSPRAQAPFPHRHSYYALLYITAGEGEHIIDFEPYPLSSNTLYFVSPGQVHFFQLHIPLEGYNLFFDKNFLTLPSSYFSTVHDLAFFHAVSQSPLLPIDQEHVAPIFNLIDEIDQEFYSHETFGRISILRAYLHILLIRIQRLYIAAHPENVHTPELSLVRQFKHVVSQNFATEQSVQAYAEKIGISAGHLRSKIKAMTGYSPGEIIRQEIVLEAKRLLAHTDLTAAQIGYRLNFEDPSYFGRFFKRETGLSSTTYRQHICEKYQIFFE